MVGKLKTRDALERAKLVGRISELKILKDSILKAISENGRSSIISIDKLNDIIREIDNKITELEE